MLQMLKGQGIKTTPQSIAQSIAANVPANHLIEKVDTVLFKWEKRKEYVLRECSLFMAWGTWLYVMTPMK